ncbi:unnamed protein product, partial [Linum tenue]
IPQPQTPFLFPISASVSVSLSPKSSPIPFTLSRTFSATPLKNDGLRRNRHRAAEAIGRQDDAAAGPITGQKQSSQHLAPFAAHPRRRDFSLNRDPVHSLRPLQALRHDSDRRGRRSCSPHRGGSLRRLQPLHYPRGRRARNPPAVFQGNQQADAGNRQGSGRVRHCPEQHCSGDSSS